MLASLELLHCEDAKSFSSLRRRPLVTPALAEAPPMIYGSQMIPQMVPQILPQMVPQTAPQTATQAAPRQPTKQPPSRPTNSPSQPVYHPPP